MDFKALNSHHSHQNCPVSVSRFNICFSTKEATFTQLSFSLSETQHPLLNYLGPGSKF